ncbi:MAG: TorF family putative porin [Bacteroidota bacterium]
MKFFIKNLLSISTILIIIFSSSTFSQSVSVNADFVSRYIWRGIDLGANTPSLQPNVKLTAGGFTAGFWGAYAFANENALEEIDFYASYSFALAESGSLSLGLTDYMNPNSGTKIGNIHNHNDAEGPGAHFVELNIGYTGPESFPISLSFNSFLYNVANNPIYFQVGYATSIEDVGLSLFVGGTPGEDSGYYGVTDFSIINVGFTAIRSIKVTDSFSVPIFGSIILNPASENLFYVLGFSL